MDKDVREAKARRLFSEKRYAEALNLTEKLLLSSPKCVAYNLLAWRCACALGEKELAELYLGRAGYGRQATATAVEGEPKKRVKKAQPIALKSGATKPKKKTKKKKKKKAAQGEALLLVSQARGTATSRKTKTSRTAAKGRGVSLFS